MSPLGPDDPLQTLLNKYQSRDPDLHAELHGKLARQMGEETRARTARAGAVTEGGVDLGVADPRTLETIVRPNARPAMLIQDNRATVGFPGPESQAWAGRITVNTLDAFESA